MFGRWHSHTMQALANRGGGGDAPKKNQLWYWAASQVTLYSDANVTSHTFADGKGIITFDYTITEVPWALRGTPITAVQLPATATSIGGFVFYQCSSLTSAILPDGITSIGNNCFWYSPLALASLPASLETLGNNAFRACPLTLASLPMSLVTIGNNAFYNCSGLAITEIPATVTSIGTAAFQSCTGLAELTFLGTPTSIGATAFNACRNIAIIRVPWSEGAVANAPWGLPNTATIIYNYTP